MNGSKKVMNKLVIILYLGVYLCLDFICWSSRIPRTVELPERDFLFGIVGTLYNKELSDVVSKAYQLRKLHYKADEAELIEVTNEMMVLINSFSSYKSKIYQK